MFFVQFSKISIKLAATTTLLVGLAGNAHAVTRGCSYDIGVRGDNVQATSVPQGNVLFEGAASRTKYDKGFARFRAAQAAHSCLSEAARRNNRPSACQTGSRPRNNQPGVTTRFDLPRLRTNALDALCAKAHQLRITEIPNVVIYSRVRGTSDGVRRECSLPPSTRNIRKKTIMAQGRTRYSRNFTLFTSQLVRCNGPRFQYFR